MASCVWCPRISSPDLPGYIRAVARGNGGAGDLDKTIAEIQRLNDEKAPPPAPEEHVH